MGPDVGHAATGGGYYRIAVGERSQEGLGDAPSLVSKACVESGLAATGLVLRQEVPDTETVQHAYHA